MDQDLKTYLVEVRNFLEKKVEPLFNGKYASELQGWKSELDAIEKLLEPKPDLTLAMLGPTQQGKSSLINALLGEKVLAVGGAVGACTAVVTSIHYASTQTYNAEIYFIGLEEWRNELKSLQQLVSDLNDYKLEDHEDKGIYHEFEAASKKIEAVYNVVDVKTFDFKSHINDAGCLLPENILQHINNHNTPLSFSKEKTKNLSDEVKRYLVGRNQHEDAKFWPLIAEVKISGPFQVLADGMVLVDLPGLDDPNPAREQVTFKYLAEAHNVWLVCNSQNAISRVFKDLLQDQKLLFRLYIEGRLPTFSVIATHGDIFNLEEVLRQMGKNPEDYNGDISSPLDFRKSEVKKEICSQLKGIAQGIIDVSIKTGHEEMFLDKVKNIPAFVVSTASYLHAIGKNPLYNDGHKIDVPHSDIPALIKYLSGLNVNYNAKARLNAASARAKILGDALGVFFSKKTQDFELSNQHAIANWQRFQAAAEEQLSLADSSLKSALTSSEALFNEHCQNFNKKLSTVDASALKNLEKTFSRWEKMHWRTLVAVVSPRRKGRFKNDKQEVYDFNEDVTYTFLELTPGLWEEFFGQHLGQSIDGLVQGSVDQLQRLTDFVSGQLAMLHDDCSGLAAALEKSLSNAREGFKLRADQFKNSAQEQIQSTRQKLVAGQVETVASFMLPAYQEAGAISGVGTKKRILAVLEAKAKAQAPELFGNMRRELAEGLTQLQPMVSPMMAELVAYTSTLLNQISENLKTAKPLQGKEKDAYIEVLNLVPQFKQDFTND